MMEILIISLILLLYLMFKSRPVKDESIYERVRKTRNIQIQTNANLYYGGNVLQYLKSPTNYFFDRSNTKYSQARQDEVVYSILKIKSGFFIEIGAFDGVTFSNTLWLEQNHNWTGLLIEANPEMCNLIDEIHRRAWRLCACISKENHGTFVLGKALGGIINTIDNDHLKSLPNKEEVIIVPCFELNHVLDVINKHVIDYLSLDIEGGELSFLQTVKEYLISRTIIFRVITIEYRVYDGERIMVNKSKNKLKELRNFFLEIGDYFEHSQLDNENPFQDVIDGYGLDVVFVHRETWCRINGANCFRK